MVPVTPPPLPPKIEPLYTSGEVAKVFGVNQATVRRWVEEGELVGFKHPGGHWRFRWVHIRELMDKLEKEG